MVILRVNEINADDCFFNSKPLQLSHKPGQGCPFLKCIGRCYKGSFGGFNIILSNCNAKMFPCLELCGGLNLSFLTSFILSKMLHSVFCCLLHNLLKDNPPDEINEAREELNASTSDFSSGLELSCSRSYTKVRNFPKNHLTFLINLTNILSLPFILSHQNGLLAWKMSWFN